MAICYLILYIRFGDSPFLIYALNILILMPIQPCKEKDKPGWRYGKSGACYTYTPDKSGTASKTAKKKAITQAIAIGGGEYPKEDEAFEASLRKIAQDAFDEYAKITLSIKVDKK